MIINMNLVTLKKGNFLYFTILLHFTLFYFTSFILFIFREALFELDEYESAREFFEISQQMRLNQGKDITVVARWIRKCDSEIKEENNPVISETTSLPQPPQQNQQSNQSTETPSQPPQKRQAPAPLPEIKYQYYQSATSLNISVLVKNLSPDDVKVDFQQSHLKILVKIDGVEG